MSRYDKSHELRKQSMFWSGPIDPKTGNRTPSPATKAGVKQWPQTSEDKRKLENFLRSGKR